MHTERVFVLGAGGQARVVIDALLVGGISSERICIGDDNVSLAGKEVLGCFVNAPAITTEMSGAFFHLAIGNAEVRQRMWLMAHEMGARALTIFHPASTISASAISGSGSFFAARCVIAPAAVIGNSVIINHGAVVDHDCFVGDFSHIAPNATIGGQAKIGRGVLVGAGANILPGIEIAAGAVIGAGSVVTKNVGLGEVWTGIPAIKKE